MIDSKLKPCFNMSLEDIEGEIWKDIPEFEGYYLVSNYGRVKSLERDIYKAIYYRPDEETRTHLKSRILKQIIDKNGFCCININKQGNFKGYSIKRLVAKLFLPNPLNLFHVNQKDEDKLNNYVDNLEWCNGQYYIHYGSRTGRKPSSTRRPIIQMNMNGEFIARYDSISVAHRSLSDPNKCVYLISEISRCCCGKYSQYKGYKWKFADEV